MTARIRSIDDFPVAFRLTLDERVRAAAGIPAFMRRKRRIEDLEESLIATVVAMLEELRYEPEKIEPAVRELNLKAINDLIDKHNRYYPIEANLPCDVRTGSPSFAGRSWRPLEPITHEYLIARATERVQAARAV